MRILDFSLLEAVLSTRKYSNNYTAVPFEKLGTDIKRDIKRLSEIVEIPEKELDQLITVKSQNGVYSRLLTFCIFNQPEEDKKEKFTYYKGLENSQNGYIKFGKSYLYPLEEFKKLEGVEIDFEAVEKSAPLASLYLPAKEEGEEDLCIFIPLYVESLEAEKLPKVLNLRKSYKEGKLGEYLASPPSGGGLSIKISELEENTSHVIIGFNSFQTQFGNQFTLLREDGQKIFTNTAVDRVLRANPIITLETPATLSIGKKSFTKQKKVMVEAVLNPQKFNNINSIDLDW